jgi:hypothetical protein
VNISTLARLAFLSTLDIQRTHNELVKISELRKPARNVNIYWHAQYFFQNMQEIATLICDHIKEL